MSPMKMEIRPRDVDIKLQPRLGDDSDPTPEIAQHEVFGK